MEDRACAKVNLTLGVLGRRADGYHELESLVVFAECGDRLSLRPGEPFSLSVSGPFAAKIDSENLIARAVQRAADADPELTLGAFALEKNLPVAAGVGGGSADAAAALRLIQRTNPDRAKAIDWFALAASLGADVPVCLAGRPALMRGIGERLEPVRGVPGMSMVLVNPAVPLAAGDVFRALDAPPLREPVARGPAPAFAGRDDFVAYLRARANDLERPASRLCPAIAEVKAQLAEVSGAVLARMSGSGPTCFALFAGEEDAVAAANAIRAKRPAWWVAATRLTPH